MATLVRVQIIGTVPIARMTSMNADIIHVVYTEHASTNRETIRVTVKLPGQGDTAKVISNHALWNHAKTMPLASTWRRLTFVLVTQGLLDVIVTLISMSALHHLVKMALHIQIHTGPTHASAPKNGLELSAKKT